MSSNDAAAAFATLVEIMARLRGPDGCPWDREQTLQTLRQYVLEEAYEVVDAIDRDAPAELCEELGDLLLQIVFQAQLAGEAGRFTVGDVARAIVGKLVRRHPHVFADTVVRDAADVVRNWQLLKDAEHAADPDDLAALVPRAVPALPRAQKLAGKLARRGFDWPDAVAVLDKLEEEVRELRAAVEAGLRDEMAHELGDVLLAAACLARRLDVPAEIALHDATGRLLERVRHVEAQAARLGRPTTDLSPAELDRLWQNAKRGG